MKISDRYKQIVDRLYSESSREDQENFRNYPGQQNGKLLWIAGRHYRRTQKNEELNDFENRVDAFNDYNNKNPWDTSVGNHDNDLVYRSLEKVWRNADEHFTKLKETKKLSYKFNSKQNPVAKRHRQVFRNITFHKFREIEERKMTEQEYTMIRDDLESWLMQTYLETKDILEKHDERKRELLTKYRRGNITQEEAHQLLYTVLQI
ncbi:MAG: hypothetical protein AABX16_00420 [Nanoarchaeota archaeon]